VRESYRSGTPIVWNRVNDLPDYVYFNHAIHVAKGVGCAECHGQVDEMPLMRQTASLQMEWCLDCHRDPGKRLRPREEVFNMKWRRPADFEVMQARLVEEYDVKSLTSCSVCHR
jgi:hypothetical protein